MDDASLLIPEKNDADRVSEFYNVSKWAENSQLLGNMARTKELVFHRLNAESYLPLAELLDIENVLLAKLSVWLHYDFGLTLIMHCVYAINMLYSHSTEEIGFVSRTITKRVCMHDENNFLAHFMRPRGLQGYLSVSW